MSLLDLMAQADSEPYRPYINTGGPIDIINGRYVPTTYGGYALSGGLGYTTAVIAEPNKFKSTLLNGGAVNAQARFPESLNFIMDSEQSVDKTRTVGMTNLYLDKGEGAQRRAHLDDMNSRTQIYTSATDTAESLDAFFDFMKKIRDEKVKNFKDYVRETEILNPSTGKPYLMILPTFVGIDSWTEAHVRQLNIKDEEFTADTEMSKQRTINMEEGWQKARLMRQLPSLCAKGGIYCYLTGHLGKKFSIDGKPTKKDMVHMGQDETVKAMGNKFNFLMSSIFKNANATALTDKNDKNQSEYPSATGRISGTELQELYVTLVRCKNTNSGFQTQMVASQRFGIMNALSYYHSLRVNKYFGLKQGGSGKVTSPLLGDLNIGRTRIFDEGSSYKVMRALEITYELAYIQNNWTLLRDQPVDYSISLETLIEKLQGHGYAIDDILESRGWWTYKGAHTDRAYLTLPDILEIVEGRYKPKFLPVKG